MSEPLRETSPEITAEMTAEVTADTQAACLVESDAESWGGRELRRLERFPVAGSRPIALRPLDAQAQPSGPWVLADILDISLGGLCLLLAADSLSLQPGQLLQLDLRSHPNFPWVRVDVEARWWISSDSFATLGLAFPYQLESIPRLELERRGQRRDPNQDPWAND
jgi:hypothetical protein